MEFRPGLVAEMADWSVLLPALSALAGLFGAVWVRRNAGRLGLVSVPNHRSSHAQPTPHGGGLSIVLGGTIAGVVLAWGQPPFWWIVPGLALLLATVGLVDDIRHLPARVRFAVQLLVVASLLLLTGLLSTDGLVVAGLLLIAGVWWINLFNFMDGIDGIAGTQALFMLLAGTMLVAWFHPDIGMGTGGWWMLCLAAATAGFLVLNWPPAKIFMGDVGSTYLAYMIFALALNSVREGVLTEVVWLILGATFIVDATVTLTRRVLAGERWFEAHRRHAYQRLARRFGAHQPVTLITFAINVLWLAPLAWASMAWPYWQWAVLVLAYLPLVIVIWLLGAGTRDKQ